MIHRSQFQNLFQTITKQAYLHFILLCTNSLNAFHFFFDVKRETSQRPKLRKVRFAKTKNRKNIHHRFSSSIFFFPRCTESSERKVFVCWQKVLIAKCIFLRLQRRIFGSHRESEETVNHFCVNFRRDFIVKRSRKQLNERGLDGRSLKCACKL